CRAGGDDRTLGSEGPPGTDGDGRGQRLEERQARRDPALVEEDLLHRLRNPVASNRGGPPARHDAYDEPTDDGNDDDQEARLVVRWGSEGCGHPSAEGDRWE